MPRRLSNKEKNLNFHEADHPNNGPAEDEVNYAFTPKSRRGNAVLSIFASVILVAAVLILPLFFELDGIWFSIIAAEIAAVLLTMFFLYFKKNRFHY